MLLATRQLRHKCSLISAPRGSWNMMQRRTSLDAPQMLILPYSSRDSSSCGLLTARSNNAVTNGWQQLHFRSARFGRLPLLQRWRSTTSYQSNSKKQTDRLPLDNCRNVDEVLQLVAKHIHSLHPNQTAAAWTFISKLMMKDLRCQQNRFELEQQMRSFLQHTTHSLIRCNPRQLSTITLTIAKIVGNIREAHQRRRVNIYHQAFGKVLQESSSNPNQGIFHALAKATDANLPRFDARCLSNTAYAYALLGYDPKIDERSLMGGIAEKSIECIHQFEPQHLANTVWSYAKLNVDNSRLFQSVGDNIVAMDDLRSFNPQNLANIVWAYAKNNTTHAGLFQKVGDGIVAMVDLSSFAPQNLANIVWAYATNKTRHHGLFQKVGDSIVAINDLSSFKPQELANIVWAYATNNLQHPNLFRKVGDVIASSDGSKVFTTQNLANIVWAYAKLDVKHPGLFKKIGKSIGALDDLSSFEPQHLANIAWSFAVTDIDVPVAFNDAFTRALVQNKNEFITMHLTQLYRWHVWQIEKSNTGLPESIRERCEQAFKTSRSSSSAPHDECSSILHETINVPKENHLPECNEILVGNISYEDDGLKASTAPIENTDSQPSINPSKATDLELMTVPELKDLLRTKGLKVGGRKEELIARLLEEVPRL
eukprot:scaffold4007_cov49-Cyclotella_meneghiniana.AAC.5